MHVTRVLQALADENSMSLFIAIASLHPAENGKSNYITHLNLSRKQYYRRIRELTTAGLIVKMKGPQNYRISLFGEAVYHFLNIITNITSEETYLKIKAMDAILLPKRGMNIKNEDINRLINVLIENPKTKEILLEVFKMRLCMTGNRDMASKDKTILSIF